MSVASSLLDLFVEIIQSLEPSPELKNFVTKRNRGLEAEVWFTVTSVTARPASEFAHLGQWQAAAAVNQLPISAEVKCSVEE